jgi:Putative bacterial sensory transduction regulator
MTTSPGSRDAAEGVIRSFLSDSDLTWEEGSPGVFVLTLPGEHRLRTTMSLTVGDHAVTINAFVARRPDENHEAVYRWLLERNRRMYGVAFAIDHLGDIYLVGRLPLATVTPDELDRLAGSVLEYSDGSFNTILELGFSSAIRREWKWRTSRGESTANLRAFAHLAESPPPSDPEHA